MLRWAAVVLALVLALGGAVAWVVRTEPDWYLRTRYPLRYEQIISGHAANYGLDRLFSQRSSTWRAASTRTSAPMRARSV